jgi:hypothetical protein
MLTRATHGECCELSDAYCEANPSIDVPAGCMAGRQVGSLHTGVTRTPLSPQGATFERC